MTAGLFDARAAWDRLSPEEQRAIGVASLVREVAFRGADACETADAAYWRFMHAQDEGSRLLDEAIAAAFGALPEQVPDLAALGIRVCRHCGCTDASGCPDGCSWVEPDLCSACAGAAP